MLNGLQLGSEIERTTSGRGRLDLDKGTVLYAKLLNLGTFTYVLLNSKVMLLHFHETNNCFTVEVVSTHDPSSQGASGMVVLEEKMFDLDLSSNPEGNWFFCNYMLHETMI